MPFLVHATTSVLIDHALTVWSAQLTRFVVGFLCFKPIYFNNLITLTNTLQVAQCEEGFYAKDKKIFTSDCDNECLESVCAKCKPCADGKTCPAGEIAESRACDESLGDECNECGCDGK